MTPLYPQKLALTSPTGGGRSVGIVRSRTKATEFLTEIIRTVSEDWRRQRTLRKVSDSTLGRICIAIGHFFSTRNIRFARKVYFGHN